MSTNLLSQTLEQQLIRGATVKVAETAGAEQLRGVVTTVRSVRTTTCNGRHCAGSWCIGRAIFVVDPGAKVSSKDSVGWRHGAVKLCLTHIQDVDGNNFLSPSSAPATEVAIASATAVVNRVTWEDLAKSSFEGDATALSRMARSLKVENETLIRRLIDAQGQVIAAQSAALQSRG